MKAENRSGRRGKGNRETEREEERDWRIEEGGETELRLESIGTFSGKEPLST